MVRKGRPHPKQKVAYRMEKSERNAAIISAIRRGQPYADISRDFDLSVAHIHRIARTALADMRETLFTEVEMYRAQQLERLGLLLNAIWDRAMMGDEKAVDAARRVIADISRITGVYSEVQIQIGESDVDRLLRESLEELNRRAAAVEGQVVAGAIGPGAAEEAERG